MTFIILKELKDLGARIYVLDSKIKLDVKGNTLSNEISERIKYYRIDILNLIENLQKTLNRSR